jgi:hypothetical protein
MEVQNVPAFQEEDYAPPATELKSRVDFIYSDDFETDPTKFWKNHGKKFYDEVNKFVGKDKGMQEAVAQIVSAADAPEVKLQKIYTRVQQLRNTSYEYWKTEEERKRANEKPNSNVEDVWKNGYGSSTELDWLFLALSRAAGFEAYPVYASNRADHFFNPMKDLDVRQLDSRLVLVKVNGRDIFCDPGAAFTPFGLLEWSETGVAGLRLDKDGGSWITPIPIPPSSVSRILRKADFTLSDAGDLQGKVTVTFTGLEAMKRRREKLHDDDTARKKYLEDDLKSQIAAASEVELTSPPDWKNSDTPLTAEFKVKIPGWLSNAGRLAFVPVGMFAASEKGVFQSEQRIHQVYFEYPSQREDDVSITLPSGWQVVSVPREQNLDVKAALYSLKVENDKGTIHLHRQLNSDMLLVNQQLYSAIRNFFQIVRTGDEQQIALQPGATKASN